MTDYRESNKYITDRIGGNYDEDMNNGEYIDNQIKAIESNDTNLVKDKIKIDNYKNIDRREDRFDPYINYRRQFGLTDNETIVKIKKTYINVNSEYRSTKPSLVISDSVHLENDPLSFTSNSRNMTISHIGNLYNIGDRIRLLNVSTKLIKLRTVSASGNGIEFTDGSDYVLIRYSHNIPLTYVGTDIKVQISDVKGKLDSTYINNIPLSYINILHTVYLKKTPVDVPSSDYFYIKIPKSFSGVYTHETYNFNIQFYSISGIPLNYINSKYPIDIDHNQGFLTITEKTDNGYIVELQKTAITTVTQGGPNIMVAKVERIEQGYPNQNCYKIDLPIIFNRIKEVNLISTEFPNSQKTIRKDVNDKIYWQNQDDGDYIYSLTLDSGYYDIDDLIKEIEDKFYNTSRITINETPEFIGKYDSNHVINVKVNKNTNEVIFKSYKSTTLNNPIIGVDPDLQEQEALDNFPTNTIFKLTLEHKNHGLSIGDKITISGAIEHMGISADIINQEHEIVEVGSIEQYSINLPLLNLSSTRTHTEGGVKCTILSPNIFRLRFNENDTVGEVLGFRDVGEDYAITKYSHELKNSEVYEEDVLFDQYGELITYTNNALKMFGDNYILMVIKQFSSLVDTGTIENAFAKILLTEKPGTILYNTFVSIPKVFLEPLIELHELEFEFYSSDGSLYNFNGLDHSFTLEIVTELEDGLGTNISSKTGRIRNNEDPYTDNSNTIYDKNMLPTNT